LSKYEGTALAVEYIQFHICLLQVGEGEPLAVDEVEETWITITFLF